MIHASSRQRLLRCCCCWLVCRWLAQLLRRKDTTAEADMETAAPPASSSLPPSEAGAMAALESSPRHGEWVDVELPGSNNRSTPGWCTPSGPTAPQPCS